MNGLEAVLWDFGGVILSSPFEAFNRFEESRGLPRDLIRRVNATNPDTNAWALFERSEIDAAGFDRKFAEECRTFGHEVRGADVLMLLSGEIRPGMVSALQACKARYKVACITNNVAAGEGPSMARAPERAQKVAEIMGLFDHVVESSKIGIRKPDPRIYALTCEALGVDPKACVYLDDLGVNLKPARAMGMATIKVESEAQALSELSAITGLAFGVSGGQAVA
jgi:putative hydrolase of the HAD superfamily